MVGHLEGVVGRAVVVVAMWDAARLWCGRGQEGEREVAIGGGGGDHGGGGSGGNDCNDGAGTGMIAGVATGVVGGGGAAGGHLSVRWTGLKGPKSTQGACATRERNQHGSRGRGG